jgi:hypothetical protein
VGVNNQRTSVVDEGWCTRIKLRGIKTGEGMLEFWKYVVALSKKDPAKPILVEDRQEGSIPPYLFLEIQTLLRSLGLSPNQKIATADLRPFKEYEDFQFGETVAYNRGWNNMRVFPTVQEAELWLRGGTQTGAQDGMGRAREPGWKQE